MEWFISLTQLLLPRFTRQNWGPFYNNQQQRKYLVNELDHVFKQSTHIQVDIPRSVDGITKCSLHLLS